MTIAPFVLLMTDGLILLFGFIIGAACMAAHIRKHGIREE